MKIDQGGAATLAEGAAVKTALANFTGLLRAVAAEDRPAL